MKFATKLATIRRVLKREPKKPCYLRRVLTAAFGGNGEIEGGK